MPHFSVLQLLSVNAQWPKAGRCSPPLVPAEPMHAVKGHVALATSIALQPRQMKSPLVALLVSPQCRYMNLMPNDLTSFVDSACVGAIEGGPRCADSSWSLWRGFQGNDFCCQVGLIGIYQSSGKVAGTCVASGQAGTATTAQLVSSSNDPTN